MDGRLAKSGTRRDYTTPLLADDGSAAHPSTWGPRGREDLISTAESCIPCAACMQR